MKQIMKRVDMQVAILLSVFVAVASMTCFIVVYKVTYDDMRFSLDKRVKNIYNFLEEKVDMSTFSDINTREDVEKEQYQEMHSLFSTAREASSVMYLYTAKKTENGRYIYVIDGLDMTNEDFRYPGDLIEEEIYEDMDRALAGEEVYPKNILHTSWGDIFICYLPIKNEGQVVGVLGIEFEAGHQYTTYRRLGFFIPVFILIFTVLSFGVSRKLFERISNPAFKDMANTDYLTGLKNRNAYQLAINNLSAMKRLDGTGIAVVDLNGLKRVNAESGHNAGDSYICLLAQAYKQLEGRKGTIYRIGGDEFIVLMEDTTESQLKQLMEDLRAQFDELRQDETLSFSYGISIYNPRYDRSLAETYHRADTTMYLSKRRFYEENPENQQFDLRHHMIQQSVINAFSSSYESYQVFDWETECLVDYGVYDEKLQAVMEEDIMKSTYSEVISAYFEPMLILEDKEEISSQLGIENIREKLTESKEFQVQGRISHDGEDSYIQLAFFRMQENDIRKDFIVAYRDVTSQVLKEEQRKQTLREALYNAEVASNAKTNFLFNMSHDIRTPMNAILGFTQIAREDMDNTERVRECLAKVEQASKHLLRLINDILDMARIESGKIELRPVVNQISFGVMETREVFQPEMREKGISFRTELKNIENDYVFCDTLRIRQIVWNLLSNSLKYTRIGGHVLYQVIQTGKEEQGFAYYELHVKDDGIGISEEFQEHLFDIFERERTSTESGVEGTGLGLAITKRLVDLMGGRIEVHSKEGVGSEFIVYLKMETAACEQPAAEETAAITSEDSFSGKRVLLAEDNELNQEIAEIILSEHGFQVETAKDGMEAVEMIQTSQPGDYDLVLMDIQMPRLNGYEATMKIRALEDPELSRIPIIAMTANAFEEDRKKAKASGMNGHIAKPIDISVLMETLTGLFCLKKGEEAEI